VAPRTPAAARAILSVLIKLKGWWSQTSGWGARLDSPVREIGGGGAYLHLHRAMASWKLDELISTRCGKRRSLF